MENEFSKKEFDSIIALLLHQLKRHKMPVKKPKAYLLGGQAGAGKTTLHHLIKRELEGNVIVIDNDRFKPLHPKYKRLVEHYGRDAIKYVSGFSGEVTEALITIFSDWGYNLIIEGTLRTKEVPYKTATLLKEKGYEVNLYVMAVPFELSYLSTIKRYEKMYSINPKTARFTPESVQLEMKDRLVENIDALARSGCFNEIRLYNREADCLYHSKEAKGTFPGAILNKVLNQTVNPTILKKEVYALLDLMEKNNHQMHPEYDLIKKQYLLEDSV